MAGGYQACDEGSDVVLGPDLSSGRGCRPIDLIQALPKVAGMNHRPPIPK